MVVVLIVNFYISCYLFPFIVKYENMKTKTKEVFYCEYCNKHGLSKSKMEYHEKVCWKNPLNYRPCFHCINLNKKETEIYGNYYNGSEWTRKVDLLYCIEKKCFLYTPKNQIKGNQFDLGDDSNIPMPERCDIYKTESNEQYNDILGLF